MTLAIDRMTPTTLYARERMAVCSRAQMEVGIGARSTVDCLTALGFMIW